MVAGIAVAVALASAPGARADEQDHFEGRSLWLEAQAGSAMPLGYYGLALELSLLRQLALSAGIGFAFEASFGANTQKMIAARYRHPLGAGWAVAVGGGTSFGTLIQTVSSPTEHTQVIASSLSNVMAPIAAASIIAMSSETGMNAPDNPPT